MSLIGLNSHDGLCAYVSEHPAITVEKISDATKSFFGFDMPERLILNFWGDKPSYQFSGHELNLVEHLSDFDDHHMEYNKFPMGEAHPFILTTKEELNGFKASKTQEERASASLFQGAFRKRVLSKIAKSLIDTTHRKLDFLHPLDK